MRQVSVYISDPPKDFRLIPTALRNPPEEDRPAPMSAQRFTVFLANLHEDAETAKTIKQIISTTLSGFTPLSSPDGVIEETLSRFEQEIEKAIPSQYVMFFSAVVSDYINRKFVNHDTTSFDREIIRLQQILDYAVNCAFDFAECIAFPEHTGGHGDANNAEYLKHEVLTYIRDGLTDIPCHLNIGYCGEDLKIIPSYNVTEFQHPVVLGTLSMMTEKVTVRRCKNCGDFFIPVSRSDTLYCDKMLPNGRTCKTNSYENRISSDPILREFRKVYKTQNARKMRHSQLADDRQKEKDAALFDSWASFAKLRMEACQAGEISVEEMVDDISTKLWLSNPEAWKTKVSRLLQKDED